MLILARFDPEEKHSVGKILCAGSYVQNHLWGDFPVETSDISLPLKNQTFWPAQANTGNLGLLGPKSSQVKFHPEL